MTGPLHGLKVLDFSTLLPGPYATMMLGDLGAEVIRVVAPGAPVMPFDAMFNRNKRLIALDLKRPDSREIVRRLIERRDVLVEQFRPGVMKRLGWDYDAARAVNENLVYCSLTGYGQTGPLRDRAGHDINYLALSGVMSHTGRRETGPAPFGTPVADLAAGSLHLVVGVLAALHHRNRTGEGQYIDVAMLDGAIALDAVAAFQHLQSGRVARREEEWLNGGLLYDFYRTRDGQYLSVAGLEPKFLEAFLRAAGLEELIRPGQAMFTMPEAEQAKRRVAERIAEKTRAEWEEIFAGVDACVEPVLDVKEMTEHPQTAARGMIVEIEDGRGGVARQIAHPIKFSRSKPRYRHAGRMDDGEAAAILREIGYSGEALKDPRDDRDEKDTKKGKPDS